MSATTIFWWVVVALAVAGQAWCVFMLIRNAHVCKYRIWVNDTMPLEHYDRLPSYDRMYWQLFRWDWSDYLEGKR